MPTLECRYRHWACVLGILSLAAVFRLTALEADPRVTLSSDFVSDETWWAHNARNHALFGRWRLDDFNQGMFAAPLHTLLVRVSFAIGGVSLRQTRMVSALAGVATVFFAGMFLIREEGFRASLIAMGILAFDDFTLSYDRSGFVEPLPTAFMTLSIFLATVHDRWRAGLAGAGIAAALACLAKMNSVFFLATPLVWLLVKPSRNDLPRTRWKDALAYLTGVVVPLMIYGAVYVAPNLSEALSQNGRLRHESAVNGPLVFLNVLTMLLAWGKNGQPSLSGFLSGSLLPSALALLWLIHWLSLAARYGFRAALQGLTGAERMALVWIVGLLPYFILHDNSADRRYYVFIVPLTILGAHLFALRSQEPIALGTSDLRAIRAAIVLAGYVFGVLLYFRVLALPFLIRLSNEVPIGNSPGLSRITLAFLATILVAVIALPVLWVLLRSIPVVRWNVSTVALIVALAGGGVQAARLVRSATTLSFSLEQATRAFAARLGEGGRVVNGHPLVFGTKCRTLTTLDRRWAGYPYYGLDYVDEFRPTHIAFGGNLDEAVFNREVHILFGNRYELVSGSLAVFTACPDGAGGMRVVTTLGRVVPACEPRGSAAGSSPEVPSGNQDRAPPDARR